MSASSADDIRPLDRLLHDLRTPLGVAHGYLRLIREGRLNDPAQREKAMAGVSDALARLTHLCDEASGRISPASAEERPTARGMVEGLNARLGAFGIAGPVPADVPDTLRIAAVHPAALVEAAAILIHALLREGDAYTVDLADDGAALHIGHDGTVGATRVLLTLPLETPAA